MLFDCKVFGGTMEYKVRSVQMKTFVLQLVLGQECIKHATVLQMNTNAMNSPLWIDMNMNPS